MIIRKNTKKARAICEGAYNVRRYALDNGFRAEPIAMTGKDVLNELQRFKGNYLRQSEKGYTIHIHSNLWLEFMSTGAS